MTARRDRLGRRIGVNPWREWITDCWRCADRAWWLRMESAACGYATEQHEWRATHPRPNLRDFMIACSTDWSARVGTAA